MSIKPVESHHYSSDYYYNHNDGYKEFQKGLDAQMHEKFKRFFEIIKPCKGQKILDIGCGRGEIAYYAAQKGCEVFSIDYSSAAVEIAKKTIAQLPAEKKKLVKVECLNIIDDEIKGKFDSIVLIDVLEHITLTQAEKLFKNLKNLVNDKSKIFISTPNGFYERYLYVFKHMIQYPWKPFKIFGRFLSGKFKPKGFREFFKKAFSVIPERSDDLKLMHVNVMSPLGLKTLFEENGFKVKFYHGNNFIDKEIVVVGKREYKDILGLEKTEKQKTEDRGTTARRKAARLGRRTKKQRTENGSVRFNGNEARIGNVNGKNSAVIL